MQLRIDPRLVGHIASKTIRGIYDFTQNPI